jgi:hypothetical protein
MRCSIDHYPRRMGTFPVICWGCRFWSCAADLLSHNIEHFPSSAFTRATSPLHTVCRTTSPIDGPLSKFAGRVCPAEVSQYGGPYVSLRHHRPLVISHHCWSDTIPNDYLVGDNISMSTDLGMLLESARRLSNQTTIRELNRHTPGMIQARCCVGLPR